MHSEPGPHAVHTSVEWSKHDPPVQWPILYRVPERYDTPARLRQTEDALNQAEYIQSMQKTTRNMPENNFFAACSAWNESGPNRGALAMTRWMETVHAVIAKVPLLEPNLDDMVCG